MGFVAIVGSGPIGGAVAHALALRDRVREIRLIDAHATIAQGKALDIQQSAAVELFSARLTSAHALHAAAGASAVVIADSAASGADHSGEPGLALVRQLAAIEPAAPFVFAGAGQRQLIAHAVGELHLGRARLLGTAPGALESAIRALAGLALDASGTDVQLQIFGTPPDGVVIGWESATVSGMPLSAALAPHAIAALNARVSGLWPPGPLALASAAARAIEAIVAGSRRRLSCFVSLDAGASRNSVVAMPAELGPRGIVRIVEPSLSTQERTRMDNAVESS